MAIAGDEVDVTPAGVTVNGCQLALSQLLCATGRGAYCPRGHTAPILLGPHQGVALRPCGGELGLPPDIEHSYIPERVKIELGWRAMIEPSETRTFTPYAAERFPNLMKSPEVTCTVLSPTRTFWEKVTALHAESFRDEVPRFFSRHYSDVATMFQKDAGRSAAHDLTMLGSVRQFKQFYYPAAWAHYDLAVPGSLVIAPSIKNSRLLASDYRDMRVMFFSQPPLGSSRG